MVAVELFVVGVGDGFKAGFVIGVQHCLGIATKVGASHGDDVGFVAGHQLADVIPQLIVRVSRNVVKLVYGNEAIVQNLHPKFIHSKAKGGMGTDQHLVLTFEKFLHRIHFSTIITGGIAEVPFGFHLPICPKAVLAERFIMEAGADRFFRYNNDRLF